MKKERFITSIFNYCDYWCERCAFTQRCRNFSMGRELEREADGKTAKDEKGRTDAVNREFWDKLADTVRESSFSSKAGDWVGDIDFDAKPSPEDLARMDRHDKAVSAHPLTRMAYAYMDKAHAWLKSADKDLQKVAQELLESSKSKFAEDDFEEAAHEIGDMLEVVQWYHTLLPPKTARAVSGLLERNDPDSDFGDMVEDMRLDDANGSAKVVLAAIERSTAAWLSLREILPNREDDILEMLVLLSRMTRGLNTAFPGAKAFVRPGFDENVPGGGQ